MNIFIPTMGRVQSQKTWDRIPKSLRNKTFLVCPEDECKLHQELGRQVVWCPEKGIAKTRQWLLGRNGYGGEKFVMTDDDHYFFRRIDPTQGSLRKCDDSDMIEMFERIETLLDKYPMVGIAARQGSDAFLGLRKDSRKNYEIEPGLALNKRTCNLYGVRADILNREGIRFDAVPLMEDMNVTLSLIAHGYDTALITEFAWNQEHSGTKGGCSSYRNFALQKEAAIKLAKIHRPFVSVIEKTSKDKSEGNWKSVGKTRFDVRVDWTGAVLAAKAAKGVLF